MQIFDGNGIAPTGDLASRSLSIWLDVDAAGSPENRPGRHPQRPGGLDALVYRAQNPARALHDPAGQSAARGRGAG